MRIKKIIFLTILVLIVLAVGLKVTNIMKEENRVEKNLSATGLTYTEDGIYFDDQPIYFWSGEFPYYRISSDEWEDRLKKVKESGVKFITAYVPWNQHEYQEGKFDFTGSSGNERRNLKKFINLIDELGLYFIPKPGPFICAEVKHGGIPDWLTDNYPEMIMKDQSGRLVGFRQDGKPLPDYLNSTYLEYVDKWYSKLSEEIFKKYQYPEGPIVAMQVENELPYSTSQLASPFSWGYTDVIKELYQEWLKDKYTTISEYNQYHKGSYSDFREIRAPKSWNIDIEVKEDWLVYQDWVMFKEDYGAEVLAQYSDILTREGITVPFYHNAGMLAEEAPMSFGSIAKEMWLGVNFWLNPQPMNNFDSYTQGLRRLKQLRGSQPNRPNIAPEVNWGWGTKDDFEFLTRYTMPFLKGANIYTVVDGYNAGQLNGEPYANEGEPFPGNAPIDSGGKLRSSYRALKRLTHYTENESQSLSVAQPISEVSLGFYPPYNYPHLYEKWSNANFEELKNKLDIEISANQFVQDFIKEFVQGDIDYRATNIRTAPLEVLLENELLIVLAQDIMDQNTQNKLTSYTESGGTLIMLSELPELNLKLESQKNLAETLFDGLELKESISSNSVINWEAYNEKIELKHSVNIIKNVDSSTKVLASDEDGNPVAVEREYGQGKAIYIGGYVKDKKFYKWLFEKEEIRSSFASVNDTNIEVVPLANPDSKDIYLFVTNRDLMERDIKVTYLDIYENKRYELETLVGDLTTTILKVNKGKVISGSLNSYAQSYVSIDGIGIKANNADELDFSWKSNDELNVSANKKTEIKINLSNIRVVDSIKIYRASDNKKISYDIKNDILKFNFEPQDKQYDYYKIKFKK